MVGAELNDDDEKCEPALADGLFTSLNIISFSII